MFQYQESITPQQAVEKRLASQNTDSPVEQPENTEVVNVSEDAPVEEVITEEAQVNEEVTPETEEPAEEVTAAQTNDEETDLLYYDIDGEEVSSTQLSEWKANGLMQADYTRKTQGHAEDVKTFNAEKEEFNTKQTGFNEKMAQIDAILKDETLTAEQLEEMWEYEPEKVKAYQERQVRLKALVGEAITVNPTKSVDMAKVSADLFANHSEWMVDGKQSKQFIDDMNLMTKYAEGRGIGQAEISSFDARHYEIMLDAARYQSVSNSNAAIEKKVRKAPVSTRPKAQAKSSITSDVAALRAKVKKFGKVDDLVKLRKLEKQLKN